ncbi:hypothetical protein OAG24_00320 [bacterium]|nr:hypothetical protein [bacterium]
MAINTRFITFLSSLELIIYIFLLITLVLPLLTTYLYFGVTLALEEGTNENKYCKISKYAILAHIVILIGVFIVNSVVHNKAVIKILSLVSIALSILVALNILCSQIFSSCNEPQFDNQNIFIFCSLGLSIIFIGYFALIFFKIVKYEKIIKSFSESDDSVEIGYVAEK